MTRDKRWLWRWLERRWKEMVGSVAGTRDRCSRWLNHTPASSWWWWRWWWRWWWWWWWRCLGWWWWWWWWKWRGWWWGWRGWKTKGGRFPRQADLQRTEIESRALGCSYGICLKSENVFQLMDDFVFVFGYQVFSNADIKWWYHQYPSSVQVIWKVNVKGIDRQTVKNVQIRFCGKSIKLTHLALKTDSVELFTRDTWVILHPTLSSQTKIYEK